MAPMLSKEMAKIDWQNQTAEQIKNLIRGLNPIMGAYTFLDGKKLKFWKAKLMSEQELLTTFPELKEYEYKLNELEAGTILFTNPKQGLFIKAKQGILQILEIQAENAKRMSTSDFLRGNNIQAGSILEKAENKATLEKEVSMVSGKAMNIKYIDLKENSSNEQNDMNNIENMMNGLDIPFNIID